MVLFACESQKEITFPNTNGLEVGQRQQPGRAFYSILWNQGRTALFSRQFFPREAGAAQIYYLSRCFVSDAPVFCYF